jgi:hypothetical protein
MRKKHVLLFFPLCLSFSKPPFSFETSAGGVTQQQKSERAKGEHVGVPHNRGKGPFLHRRKKRKSIFFFLSAV